MFIQRNFSTITLFIIGMIFIGVAFAQENPPLPGEIIISDLASPRALAFDESGNLYVADAGNGGDQILTTVVGENEITVNGGLTGRIVAVAPDGTVRDVIVGLPSYYSSPERSDGIYRVIPDGDSLWLVFSGSGRVNTGTYWRNAIVELSASTLGTRQIIHFDDFERVNDPDGNGYDTNVADIAWSSDGTAYIVDAAGNDLLSWTEADGLQLVTEWEDNPVPTAIEIADNGDLYISFLGEGMAPNSATIERWSDGELVETFTGLTAITDILLDGENLYAVEFVNYVEDEAGPGRVVQVTQESITPIVENLVAPFGIAQDADGALYISYGAVEFVEGMSGGVIKVNPETVEMDASNEDTEAVVDVMLAGDVERGREIFRSGINDAQRCANCHRVTTRGFAVDAGPNLEGIGDLAGERVESMTAEDYLRDSIVNPLNFVIEHNFQNPMPEDYAVTLTEQEIEDLVAYMLQLTN